MELTTTKKSVTDLQFWRPKAITTFLLARETLIFFQYINHIMNNFSKFCKNKWRQFKNDVL